MIIALVLAAVVIVGFGYAFLEGRRFEARIEALRARVTGAPAEAGATLPVLPAIVRNYAEKAGGRIGGPRVIHLTHHASLATDIKRPPITMDADQWLATDGPGIAWHGRGTMFGLPVSVIDSFAAGRGLLEARVAGAIVVAGGTGPDFDKGELQRYLSELPVHPDAILNNGALTWTQLDDRTVEVTAMSATGPASLQLFFDANGDITGSLAPDRPMTVGNATVPTPWRGTFSTYRQFGAYRIPSHGEVGWEMPGGLFTYWKGDILGYEPAPAPQSSRVS